MRFASAVSRDLNVGRVGQALAEGIRQDLGEGPVDLACLFISSHHASHAEALCSRLRKALAPVVLIGCTGEGIIAEGEEIEATAAAALWAARMPGVTLTPFRPSFGEAEETTGMQDWLRCHPAGAANPFLLLLADPFSTPVSAVLGELTDRAPGIRAIGGLSGGGHDLGENRMILNDTVYGDGLVGVALSGPLAVRTIVSQGCRPIGERYVITKAENNVIHELGGRSAIEQLQAVFESLNAEERRLAHQALHIGIAMDEQRAEFGRGDFLVRNLIGLDRETGSLAVGDHLREGQTVQFHVRDARTASEDLHLLLAAECSRHRSPPKSALLFSCCGRGRGLFGRPHHDVGVIRERLGDIPIAGFFAQGEIGPVGGTNFLHGYTASLALFCEEKDVTGDA
jgi:small ligand-binding sensory domain FIST